MLERGKRHSGDFIENAEMSVLMTAEMTAEMNAEKSDEPSSLVALQGQIRTRCCSASQDPV